MQITGAAVSNVNKIGGFLDKLFNKTAKVNIGLMGDGANVRLNHGWESGIVEGLGTLNIRRYGTGIVGCGSNDLAGHGHEQTTFTNNDIPITSVNNGFTAFFPSEWHSYLTNWGAATTADGATNDASTTYLGALRPYGVTGGNRTITTLRYLVLGNEGWISQTRPFEGITNGLNLQLWYLKTNNDITDGGTARSISVAKASSNNQSQIFAVNNINATAANNTATFTLSLGLTTTPGITFINSNHITLAANIKAGLTAAFPSWNPTVSGMFNGLLDGDMMFSVESSVAFPAEPIIFNVGGLTQRYYDPTYAPSLTAVTYSLPLNSGSFSPTYLSSINITADNQSLNATGPAYLARRDFAVGASANRNSNIGMLWGNSISGPWCSMFVGTNIDGATNGYAASAILNMNGQSARSQLVALRNQSNNYLGSAFQALAEHAGYASPATAPLLIRVVGGFYDITDTTASTGPSGGLSSNTQAGLRDNWQGIINRVHDVYSAHGWTASNLYWLFTSAPPTVANDSNLNFARLAAVDISNNNARAAAVNLFTLNGGITNDINGLSSIRTGGNALDPQFNTYTGYRVYSQVEWSSIQQAYGASPPPSNTAPTALFTWSPLSPQALQGEDHAYVTVDANSSTDAQSLSGASYLWSWYDASISGEIITTNGITAYISLPLGSNIVGLDVTDAGGSAGNTSGTIIVLPYSAPPAPGSPTATITAVPGFIVTDTDGNGSETILFSGAGSTSPNGAITNYAWSKNGVSTGASGVTTSMLFTVTGTNQTVGLMVTDISGNTASSLQYITVNPKTTGPGAVSNSTTVWFGGKVLTTEQYIKILEAFYPNLLR